MKRAAFSVTVVRTINAPAADLYAAWTDLAVLRRWFGTIVEADARPGGSYRVENHEADGTVNVHVGEYEILDPPHRIVMSFRHTATQPGTFTGEYVEVKLRPLGPNLTELTLTNGWNDTPMTADEGEALKSGWSEWLARLETAAVPA